jgi:hypothetical protein
MKEYLARYGKEKNYTMKVTLLSKEREALEHLASSKGNSEKTELQNIMNELLEEFFTSFYYEERQNKRTASGRYSSPKTRAGIRRERE